MSRPDLPLSAADAAGRRRAAEWLALQEARPLTRAEQADLAAWLRAEERHARLFADLEDSWRAADALAFVPRAGDGSPDPDLFAPTPARGGWRRRAAPLAAAVALAALLGSALLLPRRPAAAGGRGAADPAVAHLLYLADGSTAELAHPAGLRVNYSARERRVVLHRGEALFTVAPNPRVPFVVEAHGVTIRAVGTAFNVRLTADRVEVAVTEGTVQISPGAGPSPDDRAATVAVGQRASVALDGVGGFRPPVVAPLARLELERLLVPRDRAFAFEDIPLNVLVERFNRAGALVGAPRLVLADASLASLRMSGTIRTDDVERFVEVFEAFGVEASQASPREILLRRSESR